MPFTVSHASAIIPFHRKPFVLSALITGSMSPDFLYYLTFTSNDEFSHTSAGLFLFCLPASLIVLLIYHGLIKEPLISLFPGFLQDRLWNLAGDFKFLPLSRLGYISLSILIGAISHVLWDSFTHSGRASDYLPVLERSVLVMAGRDIALYKVLQYLSTVLGFIIFAAWFARLVWRQKTAAKIIGRSRTRLFLLMLITSALAGFVHGLGYLHNDGFKSFVVQTVIASMSLFCFLILAYSLIWHIRKFYRPNS